MNVLIDINHPAHVHLFKNTAWKMMTKGHKVLFTCKDKEFEIELLKTYDFEFISFGKPYKTIIGKIFGMLRFDWKLFMIARKFKPDVLLSAGSIYAAHVSFLIGVPHVTLEDTENYEQIILYKPFSKYILTPDAIPQKYGKKQIRYSGFHQSAFLHPNYFMPKKNNKHEFGIESNEKVFLLRLVALNATHDINVKGINMNMIIDLVNLLKSKGRLFISSEKELLPELNQYRLNIPAPRIHEFMSICDLVIGESSTMSNEAGYIGVPNIFIEDIELNVLKKYSDLGLKIQYKELNNESFKKIEILLNDIENVKKDFEINSKQYIEKSIDLTELIIETIYISVN